jgi:menaquinol-cytochrome c reductase cytochrome b/c subunit
MASDRIPERRRVFKQYKEDVAERGKPFFPYAMFHDTVMAFVVVVVIAGLAVVWKWTTPGNHTGTGAGWLGKLLDAPADPGTVSFVPRPDWYYYFLFYLLRIFKWPDTVLLGTIGVPTVCLILLLAIPFIDVRLERRLLRRPVAVIAAVLVVFSMGILTYKGATAKEALGSEIVGHVPAWAATEGFTNNASAIAGAKLFAVSGCLNCHTYLSDGGHNLGAPVLTAEGAKNKGVAFQVAHLKCPSCVNAGSPMPSFAGLGDARLKQIAAFLEASKGPVKRK